MYTEFLLPLEVDASLQSGAWWSLCSPEINSHWDYSESHKLIVDLLLSWPELPSFALATAKNNLGSAILPFSKKQNCLLDHGKLFLLMQLSSLGASVNWHFHCFCIHILQFYNPQINSEQLKMNLHQKTTCCPRYPSWFKGRFIVDLWAHQLLSSFCFPDRHLCLFNSHWLNHSENHGSMWKPQGSHGSSPEVTLWVFISLIGLGFVSWKLSSKVESISFPEK